MLVHCVAGVNRSVTTLAVFMVLDGMADSVAEAVEMIQERRTVARPLLRYVEWGEAYVRQVRRFGFGASSGDRGGADGGRGERDEDEDDDDEEEGEGAPRIGRYRKKRDKPKKR